MRIDKQDSSRLLRHIHYIVLISLVILIGWRFSCYAGDAAGRLIHSKGEITYSRDDGKTWSPAKRLMELPEGACIQVGPKGQAALLLRDRSQIRLRAGAVLCLKQAGSAPEEKTFKEGINKLLKGKMWFRNKRRGSKPLFETPMVTAAIRGTEMAISVLETGDTEVTILEGKVRCANEFGEAVISRGQGVRVEQGQAPVIVTLLKPEDAVQWLLLTPEIVGPADKDITIERDAAGIQLAKQAVQSLIKDERDKALKESTEAVEMAPERAATHVAQATILQSFGRFEEAVKAGLKGLELDAASVPALVRAVELLLGLDRVGEAKRRIQAFQGEAEPRIDLLSGYLSLIELDVESAQAAFQKAIDRRDDLSPAYMGLGLALYRQKKTAEALESMEKACLLDPLAAYPHYYLAKAQYELGEREEAEVELRRASVLDPNDPTPYMYLATILADRFRPGEGIMALEKALSLNDNRLMTRSRYLLDQDRAAKNVTMAWSLAQMGLHEWARARGEKAVWDDPTNSGAYLFRASESIMLSQIDTATLGDVRRAQLLQPVNANTYITFTDYQSLLEIPRFRSTITGDIGTDESGTAVANARGGNERIAYFAEGSYTATNGPEEGTGRWTWQGLGRAKGVVFPGHEIMTEGIVGRTEQEDLDPWQDGDLIPIDEDFINDFNTVNLGYHWRQQPGRDFLFLLQYSDKDRAFKQITASQQPFLSSFVNQTTQFNRNTDDRIWRAEAIEFFRFGDHRFSLGAAAEDGYNSGDIAFRTTFDTPGLIGTNLDRDIPGNHSEELRFYFRDIWYLFPNFSLDAGIQWGRLEDIWQDDSGNFKTKEEWLPHGGLVWQLSEKDTLRAAYFKELQPDFISGTLQPTEVAGFSRVTGTPHGTQTEFFGAGWDRQWNPKTFTRAEVFYQDRNYPTTFSPHPEVAGWKDEDLQALRLVGERLLTEQWSVALQYRILKLQAEDPDRERLDHDLSARLTWVHPSGFRLQTALWYGNQDEDSGFQNPKGDSFFIASASAEKYLFDKKGLIFARWENIFNEEYSYLALETTDTDQLPWQSSLFVIGFQWNF